MLAIVAAAALALAQHAAALHFFPAGAVVGTHVTARATGLPANAAFALVWHSGRPRWLAHDGKFYGIAATETTRVLAQGTSTPGGALTLRFVVPVDFGYLHDVELRGAGTPADAQPAATQGFTVVPHLSIAPRSGPAGTPITVTVTGLGYRFYQVVWHLMYDGAQTGWLSAVTTGGTARITIPASGGIGRHTLAAIEGPTAPYLNGQQSPNAQRYIPQVVATTFALTPGPPRAPRAARAQGPPRRRAQPTDTTGTPALRTDFASGTTGSPLAVAGSGFPAQSAVALSWETYVGNRLSGNGWTTEERPLANVTSDANGGFSFRAPTPNDLGGPHRIIARAQGSIEAAAHYAIVPSVAEIEPRVVAPGGSYTVHISGVGWTETANTYTVVLDNGDIGYGCGFNSQGDVTMRLPAPGRAGWHFIDLYPTIYKGEVAGPGAPPPGASVNGIYFLLPMLNAIDHPAEALPVFHLAFEVR